MYNSQIGAIRNFHLDAIVRVLLENALPHSLLLVNDDMKFGQFMGEGKWEALFSFMPW